jgi:hypothetical protein
VAKAAEPKVKQAKKQLAKSVDDAKEALKDGLERSAKKLKKAAKQI